MNTLIFHVQVVLVVALDEGLRPQTAEAIRIAKEANSTIIVALNKIDRVPKVSIDNIHACL
jgi:translation initiation factor IF-2